MLLVIDVGNTQTVIGLYENDLEAGNGAGDGLLDHWRIATDADRTADEHAVIVRDLLESAGFTFNVDQVALFCPNFFTETKKESTQPFVVSINTHFFKSFYTEKKFPMQSQNVGIVF